ncbi:MAG: hypothetical protein WC450_05810 [Candidatus Omnitrophota bacterium]|jgi:hypothetical protein
MFKKLLLTFEYFKKYSWLILLMMALSAFFSLLGGGVSNPQGESLGFGTRVVMPHISLWAVWGAVWGYVCGCLGCDVLFTKILRKGYPGRNLLKGVPFCILVSVITGGVNGYLSGTEHIGVILGILFGFFAGLLIVLLFNFINRKH